MSQGDIIRKIRLELARQPMSEPLALYLLVQVRKFYDRRGGRVPYRTLRLCCDWAVHGELSRRDAQAVIEKAGRHIYGRLQAPARRLNQGFFRSLISFSRLRDELARFSSAHGLPVLGPGEWKRFLHCFLGVIDECPLRIEGDDTFIDRIVVRAVRTPFTSHVDQIAAAFLFYKGQKQVHWAVVNAVRPAEVAKMLGLA